MKLKVDKESWDNNREINEWNRRNSVHYKSKEHETGYLYTK